MWNDCLDYDGKPTLDKEKFNEYVDKHIQKLKQKKQLNQGVKGRKMKF